MTDLKKKDLIAALAGIDSIAEQAIEALKSSDPMPLIPADLAHALDSARFWPEPVRLAVNAHRKEHGDATDESLTHEAARRLNATLSSGDRWDASWEVKGWREIERLETSERIFEVTLLGIDLPVEGEELIPIKRRGGDDKPEPEVVFDVPRMSFSEAGPSEQLPTDFCACMHTRGSHEQEPKSLGGTHTNCTVAGCGCTEFTLLAKGIEGVEESPPDPHPLLTIPDVADEGNAITFLRQLVGEAGMDAPDPESWMALQRLLTQGWRIVPPREAD